MFGAGNSRRATFSKGWVTKPGEPSGAIEGILRHFVFDPKNRAPPDIWNKQVNPSSRQRFYSVNRRSSCYPCNPFPSRKAVENVGIHGLNQDF